MEFIWKHVPRTPSSWSTLRLYSFWYFQICICYKVPKYAIAPVQWRAHYLQFLSITWMHICSKCVCLHYRLCGTLCLQMNKHPGAPGWVLDLWDMHLGAFTPIVCICTHLAADLDADAIAGENLATQCQSGISLFLPGGTQMTNVGTQLNVQVFKNEQGKITT